jgi:flagellin
MSSGLVLNTNINSLVAQNALTSSGTQLAQALEQLSTGLRINTAADDPAGYAIVNGMTSQINGLNQAVQNANDGVSLSQTANGALTEITNDLQTIRDLAVQSLNATNSASDRASLNDEVQQLVADIDNVAKQTSFNGVNLLDGSFTGQVFQTGANVGDTISIGSIDSMRSANLGQQYTAAANGTGLSSADSVDLADLTINGTAIGNSTVTADAYTLAAAINSADITGVTATAAGNTFTGATGYAGTATDTGTITINGVATGAVTIQGDQNTDLTNVVAAINAISAATGVTATNTGAAVQLSNANSATSGANITVGYTGSLADTDTTLAAGTTSSTYTVNYAGVAGGSLVIGGADTADAGLGVGGTTDVALSGISVANTDVLTVGDSNNAIASVDAALQQVDSVGAQLGAYQARFQAAVTGLQTASTNLSSARSSIQDTDYAAATSQLTQAQILQQAGTAMVAQANTIPQNVLTLLNHLS